MKKVPCREIVRRDCEWELIGDTDEELLRHAGEHCLRMHDYRMTTDDERRVRERARPS